MKYEIVPNSCRICLQKSRKLRSIHQPAEEGEERPNEMLKQLTGIDLNEEISASSMLPANICKPCELSLNMAYQFRIKALKSQRIIEIYCEQLTKCGKSHSIKDSVIEVKEEYIDMVENSEEISISMVAEVVDCQRNLKMEKVNPQLFYQSANFESYKDDAEYLEEPYLVEINTDSLNSDSNDALVSLPSLSKSHNRKKAFSSPSIETDLSETKRSTKNVERFDVTDMQSIATVEETAEKKLRSNKSAKTNIHDKRESKLKSRHESHICDICGNIYAKRGRMMEHRRRHNNDLSFDCEFCDKKFNFRETLRKHMFTHCGTKPYKCSFCSRTFFYESVKKAHEAIHSGYKPYVCGECNKPFAYAHALKKHKLIHADIKLYHCDYCNKDFRLQHHMKQHEETKTHQNAVRAIEASKLTTQSI